jgi:hypothetical protein
MRVTLKATTAFEAPTHGDGTRRVRGGADAIRVASGDTRMLRLASFALAAALLGLGAPVQAAEIDFSAARADRTGTDPLTFNNWPMITFPISDNLQIHVDPALGDSVTLSGQPLALSLAITGLNELQAPFYGDVDLRVGDPNNIVATGGSFTDLDGAPRSTTLTVIQPFLGLGVGDTIGLELTSFALQNDSFLDEGVRISFQGSDVTGRITGLPDTPAVPEPTTLALVAFGALGVFARRRAR